MSSTYPAVRRTHDGSASAHEELVDELDQQVRELVRRDGVDPQRDAAVVRRIAESVVRDHDERSLTGRVSPVPEVGAMVGELVARISGFGPTPRTPRRQRLTTTPPAHHHHPRTRRSRTDRQNTPATKPAEPPSRSPTGTRRQPDYNHAKSVI